MNAHGPSVDFDIELQAHEEPLRRASGIRTDERILDIGCGTGQTTRAAARCAATGSALGIDITPSMIARAREKAAAEGLHNVRFEQADAQARAFPPAHFDVAISRYGTMFFGDPIAAFRNIHSALRPGGRLAMMVWQTHATNVWSVAIHEALAPYGASQPDTHDHFSLADPAVVEHTLGAAQFVNVNFLDVRAPVYYGATPEAAVQWVRGFRFVRNILQGLDDADGARALASLRQAFAAHCSESGVWLDAREWIVTADRR